MFVSERDRCMCSSRVKEVNRRDLGQIFGYKRTFSKETALGLVRGVTDFFQFYKVTDFTANA